MTSSAPEDNSDNEITLITPGSRRVVDEKGAIEVVEQWKIDVGSAGEKVIGKVVLTDKSYTSEAATIIATFLQPSLVKNVSKVDLSDMIAGRAEEEGLKVLTTMCDIFKDCSLVEVDLSDNAMGSKGIKACASALSAQTKSLERLYLNNNGLAKETMNELADLLTKKEEDGSCLCDILKEFSIYNNMSGDGGAVAASRIFSALKNPIYIRYSGCRALTAGCKALGDGFDSMGDNISSLQKLDLNGSSFGSGDSDEHGVAALSRALSRAKSLKIAILRDCGLEAEGTELVCDALRNSGAPLAELDLAENEVTKDGSESIATLLKHIVSTLKILKLEENELSSAGVKIIMQSLSSESSVLKEISLKMNECGHVGANALCKSNLPNLDIIRLDENGFSGDDIEKLEKVFGEKLEEMEDNDEDEDFDAQHDVEEDDDDVDALAEEMASTKI